MGDFLRFFHQNRTSNLPSLQYVPKNRTSNRTRFDPTLGPTHLIFLKMSFTILEKPIVMHKFCYIKKPTMRGKASNR